MYGGGASEKLLASVLSGMAMGGAPAASSAASGMAYSLYGGGFRSLAGGRRVDHTVSFEQWRGNSNPKTMSTHTHRKYHNAETRTVLR